MQLINRENAPTLNLQDYNDFGQTFRFKRDTNTVYSTVHMLKYLEIYPEMKISSNI